jgi:hypothetical protein
MSGPYEEAGGEKYLEVTNGLDETVEMSYHGDRYVWEPGEKLLLTEAAAGHIFGYGLDNAGKETAFLRIGWINSRPECNWKTAMERLKKMHFAPVEQVFEKARARKKSGVSDRSLVDAGGLVGGADADPATPDNPQPDEDVA